MVVTAHADGDTLKRAEVTQPSGYLIKTFGSPSLQAVVERAIQSRSYCYAVDVNEHRMSDDLWRQLALVEERNRMSRDLHDTVEHSFIGIMLRMDTVRELMDSDPLAAIAELESTRALAKTGLEQVGRAVWDLQPLSIATNPLRDVISRGISRLRDEGIKT